MVQKVWRVEATTDTPLFRLQQMCNFDGSPLHVGQ